MKHYDPEFLERAKRLAGETAVSVPEVYEALIAGATDAQVRTLASVKAAEMIPRNELGERGTITDAYRAPRAALLPPSETGEP